MVNNDDEQDQRQLQLPDLSHLTDEQREEALQAAMAAKRAERKREQRLKQQQQQKEQQSGMDGNKKNSKIKFLSKKQREALIKNRQEEKKKENRTSISKVKEFSGVSSKASSAAGLRGKGVTKSSKGNFSNSNHETENRNHHHLSKAQIAGIKRSYLGDDFVDGEEGIEDKNKKLKEMRRKKKQKKTVFKFEWDAEDDTLANDADDLLYSRSAALTLKSRHRSNRLQTGGDDLRKFKDVWSKPINEMTARDWRIVRENYDIRVKGGKTPPPLRSFRENSTDVPPIHPVLLDAIENILRFKEPSPIQRQAIPIGMQRRDLVGIAETGSGKTVAFGVPLCHLLLALPEKFTSRNSVSNDGPLALVMAPTRELALQIDGEICKLLSRQSNIRTLAVVGGQSIQVQASRLREGVHILVGTPGRINECIEMAYLVLNQCSYVVLDEADRMIDLGFAPQIDSILESMGCSLKSENEKTAYEEEQEDLAKLSVSIPKRRLTAMFSATMPAEVERIAKNYLRHPAVVAIGDEDSGKNARIVQRVLFLSSVAQKEKSLQEIIRRSDFNEKIIVFVNEKKHAEGVARMVERAGKRCVVLHGGKTQDQREESLAMFKRGGFVLVATDVAGRGLDVPDVSHVVNFDLPTRSIENYTHRIGRTGRAGKEGIATSLMTEEDEGIMPQLKRYLESTGMHVPERLARHPKAQSGIASGSIIY